MFHVSAESMHFSQIALWAGLLSLLQATTARPLVGRLPQKSSSSETEQTTNGLSGTEAINTMNGDVVSTGNGTEIQTFANSSAPSSGATWSLRYLGF